MNLIVAALGQRSAKKSALGQWEKTVAEWQKKNNVRVVEAYNSASLVAVVKKTFAENFADAVVIVAGIPSAAAEQRLFVLSGKYAQGETPSAEDAAEMEALRALDDGTRELIALHQWLYAKCARLFVLSDADVAAEKTDGNFLYSCDLLFTTDAARYARSGKWRDMRCFICPSNADALFEIFARSIAALRKEKNFFPAFEYNGKEDLSAVPEKPCLCPPEMDWNRFVLEKKDTGKLRVKKIAALIPVFGGPHAATVTTVARALEKQNLPVDLYFVADEHDETVNKAKTALKKHSWISGSFVTHEVHNKGMAFNAAAAAAVGSKTKYDALLFHDADIVPQVDYTEKIAAALELHDAAHIGRTLTYLTPKGSELFSKHGSEGVNAEDEKHVNSFIWRYVGGSIALTVEEFQRIGGFSEHFWGYGCEDVEFYERVEMLCKFRNVRTEHFLHLFHEHHGSYEMQLADNQNLLARLRKQSMDERLELLRKDFSKWSKPAAS